MTENLGRLGAKLDQLRQLGKIPLTANGAVAMSLAAGKAIDRNLVKAYDQQASGSEPNAAVDKLKGVLNLVDLNQIRSDAGESADLDANDLSEIENIVSKNLSKETSHERSQFIHNLYRSYLAANWDDISHG